MDNLRTGFQRSIQAVEAALAALAQGRGVVVADDPHRENEGDVIFPAKTITEAQVAFLSREARGLICVALDPLQARTLGLEPQAQGSLHATAFTQSVDLRRGTTTGISAADRALTIQALVDPGTRREDMAQPGHVFPLVARSSGVLERRGHTEAGVDLCRLAGQGPGAVICEILNPDGTLTRGTQLQSWAQAWNLPFLTVEDLVVYRRTWDASLAPGETVQLPTDRGDFHMTLYRSPQGPQPLALHRGTQSASSQVPLVRIHSECLTGDLFASGRCDCGPQLNQALKLIGQADRGAVIYLRQEGRGVGLEEKLRSYRLQEQGLDTWEAGQALGHPEDARDYWEAAWILRSWGWTEIQLLTNNPQKVRALEAYGIRVVRRVELEIPPTPHNRRYLQTKKDRMGHWLQF